MRMSESVHLRIATLTPLICKKSWIQSLGGLGEGASDVTTRAVTLRAANFFTFTPPPGGFSLVYDSL
jgi:hypothetical protein